MNTEKNPRFSTGIFFTNKFVPVSYACAQAIEKGKHQEEIDGLYEQLIQLTVDGFLEAPAGKYFFIWTSIIKDIRARAMDFDRIKDGVFAKLGDNHPDVLRDARETLGSVIEHEATEKTLAHAAEIAQETQRKAEAEMDEIYNGKGEFLEFGYKHFPPVVMMMDDSEPPAGFFHAEIDKKDHEIEVAHFGEHALGIKLSPEPSLSFCADMYGVLLDKTGRIRGFAVADGVGSTRHGNAVAHAAVKLALKELQTSGAKFLTPETAPHFFAQIGVQMAIDFNLRKCKQQILQNPPHGRKNIAEDFNRSLFDGINNGKLGNTNLVTGFVDDKNVLYAACMSDGGLSVAKSSGEQTDLTAPTTAQIALSDFLKLLTGNHASVSMKEGLVFCQKTRLEHEDTVVVYSDGLKIGRQQAISARLSELLKENPFKAAIARLVSETKLDGKFWEDDHCIFAFQVV